MVQDLLPPGPEASRRAWRARRSSEFLHSEMTASSSRAASSSFDTAYTSRRCSLASQAATTSSLGQSSRVPASIFVHAFSFSRSDAGEQDLADVVERVATASPVPGLLLLVAPAHLVEGTVGEADDVERVRHDDGVAEVGAKAGHGRPRRGRSRPPSRSSAPVLAVLLQPLTEDGRVTAADHVDEPCRGGVDDRGGKDRRVLGRRRRARRSRRCRAASPPRSGPGRRPSGARALPPLPSPSPRRRRSASPQTTPSRRPRRPPGSTRAGRGAVRLARGAISSLFSVQRAPAVSDRAGEPAFAPAEDDRSPGRLEVADRHRPPPLRAALRRRSRGRTSVAFFVSTAQPHLAVALFCRTDDEVGHADQHGRRIATLSRCQGSRLLLAVGQPQEWRGPWPRWWMLYPAPAIPSRVPRSLRSAS